jgi:outer membrane protein assembly factor BamB
VIRRVIIIMLVTAALLVAGCSARQQRTHAGVHAAWRWKAPARASVGMPAADAAAVAATWGHHRLVLFDGAGHRRWDAERLGLRDVAPLLLPDRVVAATDTGVAAFDRGTGRIQWDVELGDRANTPVAAGPARLAVTTWDGRLLVLDLVTGATIHTITLPGDVLGPAAADADVVVASWDDGAAAGVAAVDTASGHLRWQVAVGADGVSSPALVNGAAVLVTGDAAALALDLATGARRFTAATGGAGSPEVPPFVGPELVVADRLGDLLGLTADGRVRWRVPGRGAAERGGPVTSHGSAALPVDDGRLLVRQAGEVTMLDPPGRVSGVAAGLGGLLVVATREAEVNELVAYRWG